MSIFIERIKIKNLLSFDEEGIDFELKPLNVLIGANASGKSNFVAALRVLTFASSEFGRSIQDEFGGLNELLWRGKDTTKASISTTMLVPDTGEEVLFVIDFGIDKNWTRILYELFSIRKKVLKSKNKNLKDVILLIEFPIESDLLKIFANSRFDNPKNEIPIIIDGAMSRLPINVFADRSQSIMQTPMHPFALRIRDLIYEVKVKSFYPVFGPLFLQTPNEAGVKQDKLTREGSNLASYLAVLNEKMIVDNYILSRVSEVYPNVIGIGTTVKGGRVYVTLKEKGNRQVILQPRISDGILRLIAILSILYQDNPPPLLCLEEPENGLHPEVIPVLAKAIKEASERTQLIITTHSAELLSYLDPEDIVTCERGESGGTKLERLERKRLKHWLKDYSLGDLWLKGVLGGTRY